MCLRPERRFEPLTWGLHVYELLQRFFFNEQVKLQTGLFNTFVLFSLFCREPRFMEMAKSFKGSSKEVH